MSLKNDIQKLVAANVIDSSTANKILAYYKAQESGSTNRLLIIFGVLGAFLVGMGIILIVAHNWDLMPKLIKTILVFIPMIIGQAACAYSLHKKKDDKIWSEPSAIFLILSVGACIALVSQIYHISGSLDGFLTLWMILALPVIYLMASSVASLAYIAGLVPLAVLSYDDFEPTKAIIFGVLFGAILPFYWYILKNHKTQNATNIHHLFLPIVALFGIGIFLLHNEFYMAIGYLSAFGILYMIGHLEYFKNNRLLANGYLVIGSIGTFFTLYMLSFGGFWESNIEEINSLDGNNIYALVSSITLTIIAFAFLFYHYKRDSFDLTKPIMPVFAVFLLLVFLGFASPVIPQLLINFLIMGIGIMTVKRGINLDHLGILNYGLIIITFLLFSRFLDVGLSFVLRGVLFILVGIGFFVANNKIIQKRKAHDS